MADNTPAQTPKRTKWLSAIAIAFLLYTVLGFFVVPAIIKSQLLQRLPALTKRQVTIGAVKCNPYVLSLTVDDLSLKETNGDVFASFGELYVNFQLSSIFHRAFVFDEISLRDPFAQINYFENGTFNFANLITPPPPGTPPAKPQALPAVIIYHLLVTNGAVAFTDFTRKTPFHTRYEPINVSFSDFTTLRDQSSVHDIAVTGDSRESIAWTGDITVNPLSAKGSIQIHGLKLPKYMPYSHDYALFEIADGAVDAGLDYSYDSATNALDLNVSNAFVNLNHLEIKTAEPSEDVLVIPSLSINGAEASLARRTAKVGEIKSSGGSIVVRRSKAGIINLLANLVPQPASATPASTNSGSPWNASIGEIAFDNYAIKAVDDTPAKPANISIDKLAFDLKNISNRSNAPVSVALNLQLQDTGLIGLNGTATLLPPSADLSVGVTNLDLRVAQPYVDEQVKMAITSGALTVNGHAQYASAAAPLVSFTGDVAVNHFAAADEVNYENFSTWDSLDITGINATLQPDKFQVDQIKFTHPVTTAIVLPDRRVNLLTILPASKPAATNAPPATNTLPEISLGTFAFENAVLHFADRSIEPNCTFDVQDSSGTVKGITSLSQTPATVDVHGRVDQFSTYSVSGQLDPIPNKLFTDVNVAFTNTGLTAFSPYTEVYAGRPLEKGKLSLALHYQINQKDLKAQNDIFIDQLTLGPKNGSTNATHLPVKLAIAIMKDRNGRIFLNIPLTGQLDNPKFAVWPLIKEAIGNILGKIAASPFKILGSMFGSGEELSYVTFDPGHADIPATETNKLNTLVKALYERPELTMEINGSVNPIADRDEMAEEKLDRQLKALYINDMTAAGKTAVSADQIELTPSDYAKLVVEEYTNTFGAYHAPSTNQTSAAPTPARTLIARKPARALPVVENWADHGAERQIYLNHPPKPIVVAASPSVIKPTTVPVATSTPVAAADLDAEKQQLLDHIVITSDDYRQLMQDRASQVEAYLLKSGKVTADRLFLTAPKTVQPNSTGQDRANLTLD